MVGVKVKLPSASPVTLASSRGCEPSWAPVRPFAVPAAVPPPYVAWWAAARAVRQWLASHIACHSHFQTYHPAFAAASHPNHGHSVPPASSPAAVRNAKTLDRPTTPGFGSLDFAPSRAVKPTLGPSGHGPQFPCPNDSPPACENWPVVENLPKIHMQNDLVKLANACQNHHLSQT